MKTINSIEAISSKLKGITDLDKYIDAQQLLAKEAKGLFAVAKESGELKNCRSSTKIHPEYLKGQFESVLAEGRDFKLSDDAYLACIRDHAKTQTPLSLEHVKRDPIKYWVLACKRKGCIHSFLMTGMTIDNKRYLTAVFGKNIVTSSSFVAREGRIQNEHWLVSFKRDLIPNTIVNWSNSSLSKFASLEVGPLS